MLFRSTICYHACLVRAPTSAWPRSCRESCVWWHNCAQLWCDQCTWSACAKHSTGRPVVYDRKVRPVLNCICIVAWFMFLILRLFCFFFQVMVFGMSCPWRMWVKSLNASPPKIQPRGVHNELPVSSSRPQDIVGWEHHKHWVEWMTLLHWWCGSNIDAWRTCIYFYCYRGESVNRATWMYIRV